MNNMNYLFGIVGMVYGAYAIRSWFRLRKTRDIKLSVFYPSNTTVIKRCKDKDGYINETLPKLLIVGFFAELYGAAEIYNALIAPIGTILGVIMILLFVVLVWIMISVKKMNEKYF